MTNELRFERQLPAILEDLYLGPSPDYRDDVLAAATAQRQRPAWTFPGRWLPMADIAGRSVIAPRIPLRSIGLALIIIALLAAAALVYIGSRQTRIPPPFGPARNGLIVYAADGDLFTADPVTGATHAVVAGPEVDRRPAFSRDGTRLAFLRQIGDAADGFALVVARADGSDIRVLQGPAVYDDNIVEWAPDGSYLMVVAVDGLWRYDTSGATPRVKVTDHARFVPGSFRPPDGREILVQPDDPTGFTLTVMNADGTGARPIWHIAAADASENDAQEFHWSPDGSRIAFVLGPGGDSNQKRVFVMGADGSNVRQLSTEPGAWVDTDLVWSPDGTRIAFNRWRQRGTAWDIRPIGVVSADGGPVVDTGPTPVSDGASFDWSPDGKSIISIPATLLQWPTTTMKSARPMVIDVLTGESHEVEWSVGSATSWQRQAP